jgi:hypothetical protein
MAGENCDLSSEGRSEERSRRRTDRERRFVGIRFACCDVYTRIYINRQSTAYQGNCPRCSKPITIKVGPGGTDSRFFTAY